MELEASGPGGEDEAGKVLGRGWAKREVRAAGGSGEWVQSRRKGRVVA